MGIDADGNGSQHRKVGLSMEDIGCARIVQDEIRPGCHAAGICTKLIRWIVDNLEPGSKIGVNSQCLSIEAVRGWQSAFRAAGTDYPIVSLEQSFVDGEWKERPKESLKGFWEHSMDYAGAGVELKLQELRASLRSVCWSCVGWCG